MFYGVFDALKRDLMRRMPSFPRMSSAEYWQALASPKNTVHSTPFAAADMGSSICANDSA